jgi:hypothetical protein
MIVAEDDDCHAKFPIAPTPKSVDFEQHERTAVGN